MNNVRKKMVLYAEIAIFALLTVLLAVINVINFTMVSDDADRITETIASFEGSFDRKEPESPGMAKTEASAPGSEPKKKRGSGFGPMGPDSPEINASIRYFTYAFDDQGNAEQIAYKISAVTEEEAEEWAAELVKETTGWTKATYRYRVYGHKGRTYVTVIDQGRELLPSFRILVICVCGEILVLALCFMILLSVSKKLFAPLEEADRKQKQFIANIEGDFKLPLTVINANTEVIEKENGPTEYTRSINRQVRKMTKLLKRLSALAIYEEQKPTLAINLSDMLKNAIDSRKASFEQNHIRVDTDIQENILMAGDAEALARACEEMVENAGKFSLTYAAFSLQKHQDRILLQAKNDTALQNGSMDQVFDRFTMLENAEGKDGFGLGLSYVREIAVLHNGRVGAKVENGVFELLIDL